MKNFVAKTENSEAIILTNFLIRPKFFGRCTVIPLSDCFVDNCICNSGLRNPPLKNLKTGSYVKRIDYDIEFLIQKNGHILEFWRCKDTQKIDNEPYRLDLRKRKKELTAERFYDRLSAFQAEACPLLTLHG